eukprot:33943-Eustigmatos_ZCMA.PRE.1
MSASTSHIPLYKNALRTVKRVVRSRRSAMYRWNLRLSTSIVAPPTSPRHGEGPALLALLVLSECGDDVEGPNEECGE